MTKNQKGYLVILGGVLMILGGLGWDAVIHSQEHAHLVVEALFNPSNPFENPAHIVIGLGLIGTTMATLAGFTVNWLEARNWHRQWKSLVLPMVLWLLMGVAGTVALVTLAEIP